METPQTDQRLVLLKAGHSNCLPKWEDFAKDLETQLEAQRAQTAQYAAEREHNAMQALAYKAESAELRQAIRKFRDAKGRYNTQLATTKLIDLL